MVKYVYCGLYEIDLHGETPAEFNGTHPTMIFQTKKEPSMYIVVPFTSYTPEKWEKYKKRMCCKVDSTKSIARIDRIKIINNEEISKRWINIETKSLLIPSKEDVDKVIKKSLAYLKTSFDTSYSCYLKYLNERDLFEEYLNNTFNNYDFKNSIFSFEFESNNTKIYFSMKHVKHMAKIDIEDFFNKIFDKKNYFIKIIDSSKNILVNVKNNDKKILTIKEFYDKIMVTEG